jgi:hypothetical protein
VRGLAQVLVGPSPSARWAAGQALTHLLPGNHRQVVQVCTSLSGGLYLALWFGLRRVSVLLKAVASGLSLSSLLIHFILL